MIFSYYQSDIKKCKPLGVCTFSDMIRAIKTPNKRMLSIIDQIKQAAADKNDELKQELKTQLYFFTPAVLINNWRSYENIDSFSGLMPFDYDKLEPDYAKEFKEFIFNKHKFIVAAWISVSGRGVRFLVKIPEVKNIDQYKKVFEALDVYEELGNYNGFDPILKNPIQPLFTSYDSDILTRDDYETYFRMYVEPKNLNRIDYLKDSPVNSNNELRVKRFILKKMEAITDNGHHPLRAAAYWTGGHVATGSIEETEAISFFDEIINTHSYLKQKADTYKKTVKYMINSGKNQPLNF